MAVELESIPHHRKSNPDRTLFAMGMSNICSSLAGGLTIIPGGIKSTTNILSGGKTLWAEFLQCLLPDAATCSSLAEFINMIPLAALAAILIHIGYKLCEPKKWAYAASVGKEQLFLFASTIAANLVHGLALGLDLRNGCQTGLSLVVLTAGAHWKDTMVMVQ